MQKQRQKQRQREAKKEAKAEPEAETEAGKTKKEVDGVRTATLRKTYSQINIER